MCRSGGTVVKNVPAKAGGKCGFDPWVWKIPCSRKWQFTLVFLPGEFHGQRGLEGYSPWGCKRSDMTEHTDNNLKVCSRIGVLKLKRIVLPNL